MPRLVPLSLPRLLAVAALLAPGPLTAQVTSPEDQFGHQIGANYELVNYAELQSYWELLAAESDRMVLDTIGFTEEGRPQLMAILTSPENHRSLDRFRQIAKRLAQAKGVSEEEARELSQEGKAVVWIDGGLHATEVVGAQQIIELVYRLTSKNDAETRRFLDDLIVLAVHCNPDGMDLVSNWYHRNDDTGIAPEERRSGGLPVLYHYYAGHDNNRDFYMGNLAETTNMLRVQYREWFPQIIYNHHQTGPQGTIMFVPPFRDPPNHFLDPLIMTSLDQVGSAMHHRFVREGKGGTTMRSGASYSIWWNGGLRTTPYYHNAIGLLTEIRGGPNPETIPFVPQRQLATTDIPLPVEPGELLFRTSIEYSQTANWAVMDYASRNKDILLYNIWKMGNNSVERGEQDSWTIRPKNVYEAADALGNLNSSGTSDDYRRFLKNPENRDPRGFILPADQADFPTAVHFANALLKNGVEVQQATAGFMVDGERYPEGSLIVKTAQAYRPHVLDMFEPQDHPNDFAYPGGPPIPPYDATGWTLSYQMGVETVRVMNAFDGPFQAVSGVLEVPAGVVGGVGPSAAGYLLPHDVNSSFSVIYRLLGEGSDVFWLKSPVSNGMEEFPAGTFWVSSEGLSAGSARALAEEFGVTFYGLAEAPQADALQLQTPRIGLWDRYGGSMPSGWVRFILDQFGLDYSLVFPAELDEGGLSDSFDVLIFPDGAIPSGAGAAAGRYGRGGAVDPNDVPAEYRDRLGSVTVQNTVPQLKAFLEDGGTIITLEGSTALGYHLGLPIVNHLTDGSGSPLRAEEFFVPGSLLEVDLIPGNLVTAGLDETLIVNFARSPVFGIEAGASGVRPIAQYGSATPLRSGWAWGQEKLEGGIAMLEATVGDGTLFLFGPQVTYRGQTHAAYPLFFNGLFLSTAREGRVR